MSYRLSNIPVQKSRSMKETRKPKSKVLFFVEGIQTEIIYLNELKNHVKDDKNVQVKIFDRFKHLSGESNQLNIVRRTKKYLETCQGLGKKKKRLIEQTIHKLEFGEWSINEIYTIIKKLESDLNDTILSAEDHLEAQLQSIKACYDFEPGYDKICFILDRDFESFSKHQYDNVLEICEKEGFELGISSPNFEFYLLMHLTEGFKEYERSKIFRNENNFSENVLKKIMREEYGEIYKKNKYNAELFFEKFHLFKRNIEGFSQNNVELKSNIGTSVGLVIGELID